MSEYTPTTDEIRATYAWGCKNEGMPAERAAAARALEEAADAIRKKRPEMGIHILPTPYRDGKCCGIDLAETIVTDRAAEIREGKLTR